MNDVNGTLKENPKQIEADRLLREIGFLTKTLVEVEDSLALEQDAHKTALKKLANLQDYEQRYLNIMNSTSWKVTSPLRTIALYLRR